MELLLGTWHWAISGFIIGLIMLLLTYFGKAFGMSSNLRTLCSMTGAGKRFSFFDWDWKSQRWNLVVVAGAVLGGFVASQYLSNPSEMLQISSKTIETLETMQIDAPEGKFLPDALFGQSDFKNIFILLIGGLLIGFGSRYAGGCTSGHAISGLSNLQIPSLKAVIGFFIGGLVMVHLILPLIFNS
jgi:uncharacterized membrane protein YedE/YeeE